MDSSNHDGVSTPEETVISPDEKARVLASAIVDKKGEEVALLDVEKLVDYADRFIIATGTNPVHLQAMTDALDKAAREAGFKSMSVEGSARSSWILMDYGDVLVHLFLRESRGLYDLDGLWVDARRENLTPDAEFVMMAR